jgi:hypothetical protein
MNIYLDFMEKENFTGVYITFWNMCNRHGVVRNPNSHFLNKRGGAYNLFQNSNNITE